MKVLNTADKRRFLIKFDVINIKLLIKWMRIIRFPKDFIMLVEKWLNTRFYFVNANGT